MGQVYVCAKCKVKLDEKKDEWVLMYRSSEGLEIRAHAACLSQHARPAIAIGGVRRA